MRRPNLAGLNLAWPDPAQAIPSHSRVAMNWQAGFRDRADEMCRTGARIFSRVFEGFSSRGTNVVHRVWFNAGFGSAPRSAPENQTIHGPAKHRLHPYEAGWLTLLLKMGVASEKALREAQNRVAQAAIDEMEKRQGGRRAKRGRRREWDE